MPGKVASQQQLLKHGSSLDKIPSEDDVRRHDWLFKDGPFHLGRPLVEYWAENQVLCIKLGDSPLPPMEIGPVEYLQCLIDEWIDPSSPFQMIADFEPGQWPIEQGYRRLGYYLAFVGKHKLDYGCWSDLQIYLPHQALPYDPPPTPIIPLDTLTNLRHLTWFGHRNQLCRSWLPLVPSIMQSLYTLDLNCELSIEDCSRILLHGNRLKHFIIDAIERNVDQVLTNCLRSPSKYRSGEHERPHLEFLKIKSSVGIDPLLHPFYFPSLKSINLILSYPTKLKTLPPAFEWKNMEQVTLICDILEEESEWIKSTCNPETQHNHIGVCRFLDHVQVSQ
ncbi:hypothetical protein C0995_005776 [Termitomyces sp. Mi166|nr:hypothetical protein C0995_005776 [Termitomyces sp. Mi166\